MAILKAGFTAVLFLAIAGAAAAQTYGGYDCTIDCSGHRAGYEWAAEKRVISEVECFGSNSRSFDEGCRAYVEDPYRDADEDDDGNYVFED